jgi:hypothetical protein
MRGLASQGSERWRSRGSVFSLPLLSCPSQRRDSLFSLVPRLRLLSPCSALLAGGGGRRGSKFKRAPTPTSPAACLTALLMLAGPHSFSSAQVVSLSCNAGYFGEGNAVEYKGLVYRTLDGASPLDARTDNWLCQNYYLGLPSGWALAADNADSLAVIRSYRWGTSILVVAGGRGYITAYGGPSSPPPGSLWSSNNGLTTSGSTYKAAECTILILISKAGSACTACPAGESEVAGRECGTRMCVCVCVSCFTAALPLSRYEFFAPAFTPAVLMHMLYSCRFTPIYVHIYRCFASALLLLYHSLCI